MPQSGRGRLVFPEVEAKLRYVRLKFGAVFLSSLFATSCGESAQDATSSTGDAAADPSSTQSEEDENTEGGPKIPEPETASVYKPCPLGKRWGRFRVSLQAKFSSFEGSLANGVVPAHVPDVVKTQGDCTLYQPPNLACDPPCGPNERCDRSGKCIDAPRNQDLGKVYVRGMSKDLDIAPREPGFHYVNGGTLPHPVTEPSQELQLFVSDAPGGALALHAYGIEALAGTPQDASLEKDKDLALTWTAAKDPERSKMVLSLNVNNHGAAASWISCSVPDTGSFALPATLVTQLLEAGVSGFPSLEFNRMSVDSKMLTGQPDACLEFSVQSPVTIDVKVPGVVSCKEDSDCPEGQTCRDDLTCG